MNVVVFPGFVLKHTELDVVLVTFSGDTSNITKTVENLSIIASSSHAVDSQQTRIIPTVHVIVEDQFVEFPL